MNILQNILQRIITFIQFILVFIYLIFDEIIWDRLIVPIYRYISSLKILHTLEHKLLATDRHIIVVLFIALFAIVEILGIVAAGIALSGNVILGVVLYLGKIPIAAFTFWMFGVVKSQLMTFGWFNISYDKMEAMISWIKSTNAHKTIMSKLHNIKIHIKNILSLINEQLPNSKNGFIEKTKLIYIIIKKNISKK